MTIVEVRGGTIVAIYSDNEETVIIVDHDDAECNKIDAAGTLPIDSLKCIPEVTLELLDISGFQIPRG